MKYFKLNVCLSTLIIFLFSKNTSGQFDKTFWESRQISDSLSENESFGFGEWIQFKKDSFELRIMSKHPIWSSYAIEGKERSLNDPEAIYSSINEIKLDSNSRVDQSTFLRFRGKISRDLFDIVLEGFLINDLAYYNLTQPPHDPTPQSMEYYHQEMKNLDSSLFMKPLKLKMELIKNRFIDPAKGKSESIYFKLKFNWDKTIYKVTVPLNK